MSENTVNVALRRLGFDKDAHSAHGFRSTARTLIVERLDVAPDVVEAQLAHMKSGPWKCLRQGRISAAASRDDARVGRLLRCAA
jgi:hypothetical protein